MSASPQTRRSISLRDLIGDATVFGLGGVFDKGVGFVLLPITTAFLTPDDYGILGLYSSTIYILCLAFSLGVPAGFLRFYAECRDSSQQSTVVTTALVIVAAASAAGLATTIGVAGWVGPLLFGSGGRLLLVVGGIVSVLTVFIDLASRRLQGDGRSKTFLVVRMLTTLVNRGPGLVLIVAGYGAWGWILAECFGQSITLVVLALLVFHNSISRTDSTIARAMTLYGIGLAPGMLSHWVMVGLDKFMLLAMVDNDPHVQIGLYTVAERISSVMQLVNVGFLLGWRRFAFYNLHAADGPGLLARGVSLYVIVAGYGAMTLALLGDDLTHWLIPSEYEAGTRAIPALTAAAFFAGLAEVVDFGLLKAKRTFRLSLLHMTAAAVNVGVNLLLIPRYGIVGAAAATLGCQCVKALLIGFASFRAFPVPYDFRRMVLGGGVLVACYFAGWTFGWSAIDALGDWRGWLLATLTQTLIALCVPAILLQCRVVSMAEWSRLVAVLSRARASQSNEPRSIDRMPET